MEYKDMNIIVVDDITENIQITLETLKHLGCSFQYAKNGIECLKRVPCKKPDLILLDIMMPEMGGFETCKILKDNPKTKDIPIIFLSAYDDIDQIVQGFKLGAVDYISKPFNKEELIARVKTHLNIVKLFNENIEKSKRETISKLTSGLIHEINTPLTPIKGSLELMRYDLEELEDSKLKDNLLIELTTIDKNIHRIKQLSNSFQELTKKKEEDFGFIDINQLLINSLIMLHSNIKENVEIQVNDKAFNLDFTFENNLMCYIQEQRISQVIMSVIKNSMDAIEQNEIEKGKISISIKEKEDIEIQIEDNAKGVEEEKLKYLFENPLDSKKTFGRLGIGLYVAKKMIEKNNGSITAQNSKNGLLTKINLAKYC